MQPALDISQYQGAWQDRGDPIVMIRMSSGEGGLHMDTSAAQDYNGAVADGRAVGGYHFAGGGNVVAEATYFMQCMSPLAENDVYALDVEDNSGWAPSTDSSAVTWVNEFVTTVHQKIGVWPLVYMNLAMLKAHDWSSTLSSCGLWLADWNNDPAGTIPAVPTYVMQQYSDGPVYDHDEWFGTVAEFQAYGYHAPVASPPVVTPPAPVVTPVPSPAPVIEPTPAPIAQPVPSPSPPQKPPIVPTNVGGMGIFNRIIDWLKEHL